MDLGGQVFILVGWLINLFLLLWVDLRESLKKFETESRNVVSQACAIDLDQGDHNKRAKRLQHQVAAYYARLWTTTTWLAWICLGLGLMALYLGITTPLNALLLLPIAGHGSAQLILRKYFVGKATKLTHTKDSPSDDRNESEVFKAIKDMEKISPTLKAPQEPP